MEKQQSSVDYYIRTYKSNDLAQFVRIFVEGMYDTRPSPEKIQSMSRYIDRQLIVGDISNLEKSFLSDENSPKGNLWVCVRPDDENNEEIIGSIGLIKISDEICELKRFSVKREYRRKGIGLHLIKHALEYASKEGFSKCILQTDVYMKPAIELYYKVGFKLIREFKYKGSGTTLVDMEYDLKSINGSI